MFDIDYGDDAYWWWMCIHVYNGDEYMNIKWRC